MSEQLPTFTNSAKELARNPLGIIALFIVLVYGFACLLFSVSASNIEPMERQPIIWFVVLFPVVVLFLFGWLVSRHHDKLYAPQDYRNDDSFLKTIKQKAIETSETKVHVDDLLEFGGDLEIITENQKLIESDMNKRGLSHEGDTSKVLVRQLAATQAINWFERTYFNIFGSQIKLCKLSATKNGLSLERAKEIFTDVKSKNMDNLGGWDFDQYISYLIDSSLITKESEVFKSTTKGNEFIKILESSNYSAAKNL